MEVSSQHWQLKHKIENYGDSFEIIINIEFSTNFPYQVPNIYFSDIYIHPWIDGSVLKTSYPVPPWESSFLISDFINSMLSEFISNPPKRVGNEVKNNRRISISESIDFPEVKELRYIERSIFIIFSISEVKRMLSNEELFIQFFDTTKVVGKLFDLHEDMVKQNYLKAKSNVLLSEKKSRFNNDIGLTINEINGEIDNLASKVKLFEPTFENFSSFEIISKMEADITSSETLCDDLVKELKSGKINPFEFTSKYRQIRSNYHRRNIQLQKLREISQKSFQ